MIRLCLFDLDQTLVDTEDMKELRERGAHTKDAEYVQELKDAFRVRDRALIDEISLLEFCMNSKGMKIGIFTRAPRIYAETIIKLSFTLLTWDLLIAHEDVRNYKPHREGIYKAMTAVGLNGKHHLSEVLIIGDSDVDIRAAYHAGCAVALFKGGWPSNYQKTHWKSIELLPDAVVKHTNDLVDVLVNPIQLLPDLECLLADATQAPATPRFDKINKFFPWEDNDRTPYPIYAAGRSFSGYESLNERREMHLLSRSIQENKNSDTFPESWILSIKRFISSHYLLIAASPFAKELVITVIPPRPDRKPRLNLLLSQLKASYGYNPHLHRMSFSFESEVLVYQDGVRSHSREHLSREDRFANVRDHLLVRDPASVKGRRFLVIDDVSTTGASLLYARRRLKQAGASSVECFTIAESISDPVRNA